MVIVTLSGAMSDTFSQHQSVHLHSACSLKGIVLLKISQKEIISADRNYVMQYLNQFKTEGCSLRKRNAPS